MKILEELKINIEDCEIDARFNKDSHKLFNFDSLKKFSDGE
jgi:hypothetical protein